MKLAVICFTKSGYDLMNSIENMLADERVEGDFEIVSAVHRCKALLADTVQGEALSRDKNCYYPNSIEEWAQEHFQKGHALLFIGATGIAVRAIASSVKSKLSDSPVLVMDEKGRFVIPILSGHVGGANELAEQLSSLTGAIPVITTATDIENRFSVDVWAKKNHLTIREKEKIKEVSSKILAGEEVTLRINSETSINPGTDKNPEADITIGPGMFWEPKEYVVGIGCKKGKTEEEIRGFLAECLGKIGITMEQIRCFASIDVKAEEAGILALAEKERIPFVTFSKEELNRLQGEFHESDFVKETVGVGSVCERAAMLGSISLNPDTDHELNLPKQAKDGVTIAIARRRWTMDELDTNALTGVLNIKLIERENKQHEKDN